MNLRRTSIPLLVGQKCVFVMVIVLLLSLIFSLTTLGMVYFFRDTIKLLQAEMRADRRTYQAHLAEEAAAHREHLKELEIRLQSRSVTESQEIMERRVQDENRVGNRGDPDSVDIFSDALVPPQSIKDTNIAVEGPGGELIKMSPPRKGEK